MRNGAQCISSIILGHQVYLWHSVTHQFASYVTWQKAVRVSSSYDLQQSAQTFHSSCTHRNSQYSIFKIRRCIQQSRIGWNIVCYTKWKHTRRLEYNYKSTTLALITHIIIIMYKIQRSHRYLVIQLQKYWCWKNTHIFY